MTQAMCNIAAALGALSSPLIIGGLQQANPVDGWRQFFWYTFSLTFLFRLIHLHPRLGTRERYGVPPPSFCGSVTNLSINVDPLWPVSTSDKKLNY